MIVPRVGRPPRTVIIAATRSLSEHRPHPKSGATPYVDGLPRMKLQNVVRDSREGIRGASVHPATLDSHPCFGDHFPPV